MIDAYVSVIMPVFNRVSLVSRAIDSVLAQTYKDFEIILVNDGSTDGTGSVLDGYAHNYPCTIKVIHQKRTGQVIARNRAINLASGKYIAFLDSDDLWLPQKLSHQLLLFKKNIGLVYSGIFEIDQNEKIIRKILPQKKMRGNIFYRLLEKNTITGGTVVITREALEKIGVFDPNLKVAENWDLWIRISRDFLVDFVNEPLVKYLKHEGNMSSDVTLMQQGSKAIYDKHLPKTSKDFKMRNAQSRANAYLHYCFGVFAFGNKDYVLARKEFLTCWKYSLFYRDTLLRYFRTYVGIKGNAFISSLRNHTYIFR